MGEAERLLEPLPHGSNLSRRSPSPTSASPELRDGEAAGEEDQRVNRLLERTSVG